MRRKTNSRRGETSEAKKRSALLKRLKDRGADADTALLKMLWVWDEPGRRITQRRIDKANRISDGAIRRAKERLDIAEIERRRRTVVFDFAIRGRLPLSVVMKHFESVYEMDANRLFAVSFSLGIFANHLETLKPSPQRSEMAKRLLELSEMCRRSRLADAKYCAEATQRFKVILKGKAGRRLK